MKVEEYPDGEASANSRRPELKWVVAPPRGENVRREKRAMRSAS